MRNLSGVDLSVIKEKRLPHYLLVPGKSQIIKMKKEALVDWGFLAGTFDC